LTEVTDEANQISNCTDTLLEHKKIVLCSRVYRTLYLSVNARITLSAAANAPADNTKQGLKVTWRKYNKYIFF
jgi:hypothetical protein